MWKQLKTHVEIQCTKSNPLSITGVIRLAQYH